MSNPVASYSQNLYLGEPPAGSADYDRDLKQNFRIMDFINQRKNNFIRSGLVVSAGSGLTVNWTSGAAEVNGTPYTIGSSSGSATNNTSDPNIQLVNYVFVNNSGTVTISTSLPTTEYTPLALVFTNAGIISKIVDCRKIAAGSSDSPSFTTVKLSALTDGYIPKHTSDAVGLANSPIYVDTDGKLIVTGVAGRGLLTLTNIASGYAGVAFVAAGGGSASLGASSDGSRIAWANADWVNYDSDLYDLGISTLKWRDLWLSRNGYKLGGGSWSDSSDIRIKKDITPANLERCYEIVKSTPLIHFGWDDGLYTDEQVKDKHSLGWLADDVEKVFPKVVDKRLMEYRQKIEDGVEEYEERDFKIETKEVKTIEVIDGKAMQKSKTEERKVPLFDNVEVVDETGNVILDRTGNPLIYKMPRMVAKTRPKMKPVKIVEDCKIMNETQLMRSLYGAVQLLIQKVEKIEAVVAQ